MINATFTTSGGVFTATSADSQLVVPISAGESLEFTFALVDQEVEGWALDIVVRQFTDSPILIQRTIEPDAEFHNVWSGFLTSTETAALDIVTYRLIGFATNSNTDEERQIVTRLHVSKSWVD